MSRWEPVASWTAEQPQRCTACGRVLAGRDLGTIPNYCLVDDCPGPTDRIHVEVEPVGASDFTVTYDEMDICLGRAEKAEAERDRYREALVMVYLDAPAPAARVCDEFLDRTGKLLGEVRREAAARSKRGVVTLCGSCLVPLDQPAPSRCFAAASHVTVGSAWALLTAERDRYRQALETIRPVIQGVRVGALGLAALDDVDERIELALNPARRNEASS